MQFSGQNPLSTKKCGRCQVACICIARPQGGGGDTGPAACGSALQKLMTSFTCLLRLAPLSIHSLAGLNPTPRCMSFLTGLNLDEHHNTNPLASF